MGAEKITFLEMKRRWISRTEKNEIILTCPCANRLRAARLRNPKNRPSLLLNRIASFVKIILVQWYLGNISFVEWKFSFLLITDN